MQDARQAVDDQGRKIIPEQDFVEAYSVRTVLGALTGYPTGKMFVTVIAFCREMLEERKAELFLPLVDALMNNTTSLASAGAIFAEPVPAPMGHRP